MFCNVVMVMGMGFVLANHLLVLQAYGLLLWGLFVTTCVLVYGP